MGVAECERESRRQPNAPVNSNLERIGDVHLYRLRLLDALMLLGHVGVDPQRLTLHSGSRIIAEGITHAHSAAVMKPRFDRADVARGWAEWTRPDHIRFTEGETRALWKAAPSR